MKMQLLFRFFLVVFALPLLGLNCSANNGVATARQDQMGEQQSKITSLSFFQLTGIEQAPTSETLYLNQTNGSDFLVRSKIQMPMTDFTVWITGFHLDLTMFNPEKKYLLGPEIPGWDVDHYSTIPTAQVLYDDGKVLDIGYVAAKDKYVQVFLVYHGL